MINTFTQYNLTLSGAQISDLFFNHEHPNLDALYKRYGNQKEPPTQEEIDAETFKDAIEFYGAYLASTEITPQDLADDFKNRI